MSPLVRAFTFLRPHRRALPVILGLALGVAATNAIEPLILKRLLDGLLAPDPASQLLTALALLLGLGLLREAMSGVSSWLTWRTRIRVPYSLTEATVGRLHSLPVSFHRDEGVGAVMTKLDRGIQGFVGAITDLSLQALPAIGYLALAITLMVKLDLRLALLVVAFAPFPLLIARAAGPHQLARERQLMQAWVRIYARFNEVLSGILTVKSFAMESREKQRFLTHTAEANAVVTRGVGFDSGVTAVQGLVVLLARASALGYGSWRVARGEMTLGTLMAFLGYIGGLFGPVQALTGLYRTVKTASAGVEQVFGILDAQDSLGDAPDAEGVPRVAGEVTFENVSFGYLEGKPLLRGIDLHVRPGERVALVGPSGAGKTTLMALLCRFYDPTAGVVRVDGRDIRRLKQAELRRHIGVVLQDSLLFNESVRANIAYGRPEATQAQVEAAARAANAHEFIGRLPQGYDTLVGERGCRLSAGERQRISIARSLLKDPEILVLDEPTSALDAENEVLVQSALERLAAGRTTFSIAHRLSTVVGADRIIVLEAGRIVDEGTHQGLMARPGPYRTMVLAQTGRLVELPPPEPITPRAA